MEGSQLLYLKQDRRIEREGILMPKKRYLVSLTEEEHKHLKALTSKGRIGVRQYKRARILLLAGEGRPDAEIASLVGVGRSTVERVRQRFVLEGLQAALKERARPGARPKLDAKGQAVLVALAQSAPPPGRKGWTLQLLADKLVELQVVESLSGETVRRVLKKIACVPG